MANRWGTVGTVADFIFLGSKITADVTAAMKLKDAYSLQGKFDQPRQHIKKQRHYFTDKVHIVKATVFPVALYGCKIWTVRKAESRRIDTFEL